MVRSIQDTRALQELAPLGGPFLPWTTFSMRPSAIASIVNDIYVNRRGSILELGSGNSTVFAARALAQIGTGHIDSLDHDPQWAQVTEAALEREGLGEWATVTHAPLVNGWYDQGLVPTKGEIDLLVIDGPPAHAKEIATARQPALDLLQGKLIDGATVILDDSRRPGEKRIVESWKQSHGIELHDEPGGHAIGTWSDGARGS